MFTRKEGNPGARVTLARGLPYLPYKRSARDNSPTPVNFPPSCVTGIIQFLSYKHLKNKKLCSVNDDNIFPVFRQFNVSFHRELQDYFKFWTSAKLVKLTRVIG